MKKKQSHLKDEEKAANPGSTRTSPPRLLEAGEILLKRRLNPLSKAITFASKIKHPDSAVKAWLEIASFFYAKPKGSVATPGSKAQSAISKKTAAKLLSELENAAKRIKEEPQKENDPKETLSALSETEKTEPIQTPEQCDMQTLQEPNFQAPKPGEI